MLKRGDILEVIISDLDEKGRGIAETKDRKILIYFVIPGDFVKVKITRVRRKIAYGSLIELKTPSKYRVKPKCRFFGQCGGCKLQNMDYHYQLYFKRKFARRAFEGFNLDAHISKVDPSRPIWFYRNRMDYAVGQNLEVGLRKPEKWNEVVDIDECFLLSERGNELLNIFREFIRMREFKPFNTITREGFLRYLVLREGKFTSKRLVNIVTYLGEFRDIDELVKRMASSGATSIYWSINPRITDISFGEEIRKIHGEEYLREKIRDYVFNIHPNAFFQTNSYQAVKLIDYAAKLLDFRSNDVLLDLYCGVGLFGIALHSYVDRVIGLELDREAIKCAEINALENDARNVKLICGRAEDLVKHLKERINLAIVDPPRPGLHPKVIKALLKIEPREILYVSCNPNTMARDIALLSKKYKLDDKIRLIDMFPQTPHVEAMAKLVRR